MALFKAVVWALIFLTKLRFPPGVSIAIYLTLVDGVCGRGVATAGFTTPRMQRVDTIHGAHDEC